MWEHKALITCNASKWYLKILDHLLKAKMDDGIPSLSSDSATIYKEKKNSHATFKTQMERHCLYLKANYDTFFKVITKYLPL